MLMSDRATCRPLISWIRLQCMMICILLSRYFHFYNLLRFFARGGILSGHMKQVYRWDRLAVCIVHFFYRDVRFPDLFPPFFSENFLYFCDYSLCTARILIWPIYAWSLHSFKWVSRVFFLEPALRTVLSWFCAQLGHAGQLVTTITFQICT